MPPVTPFIGFGRTCFLTWLMPSTVIRRSSTRASTTPRLPLSLPAITTTSSPLRMRSMAPSKESITRPARRSPTCDSQHFRRERDNLHETLGAQLARDRPENTGSDRLQLVVQQYRGVAVELDGRAVQPAQAARGADHHRVVDLALLHAPARSGVLHRHLDDVPDVGVAALAAAQHLDTHHGPRAGVVGD